MRYPVLLNVLAFLFAVSLHAQPFNFRNYSDNDGLPDSPVTALYEDSRGFLWVGTEAGLFRFDGYGFQTFQLEGSSQSITAVFERQDGTLCIGTTGGLLLYNGAFMQMVNSFSRLRVTALAEDSGKALWVGTPEGLFRETGNTFTRFSSGRKENPGKHVHALSVDGKTLWIATDKGAAQYDGQQFRLFTEKDGLPSNEVRSVFSSLGRLLFATPRGLYNAVTRERISSDESINAVAVNGDEIWYGGNKGLSQLKGKRLEHFNPSSEQGDNNITAIHFGRSGTLWVGTRSQGLYKLQSQRFSTFTLNDQMGKSIYSVATALNGNVMCGSSLGGVTVFDGKNFSRMEKSQGFSSSIATCFHYTPDSTLWIGTSDDGLFRFTRSGIRQFTKEDNLPSNNITTLANDTNGVLWVGTGANGVALFNVSADSVNEITTLDSISDLASDRITVIKAIKEKMYIGTEDQGLVVFEVHDSLPRKVAAITSAKKSDANQINGISVSNNGKVYVATGAGVGEVDGNKIRLISSQHRFSSERTYAVAVDKQGHLWAATQHGLDRISVSTSSSSDIIHFSADEGYSGGEVYRNAITIDQDGNVWFGTMNGLVRYTATEEETRSPEVYITGMKLFFDDVAETEFGDTLKPWFSIPPTLNLPYDKNNVTFLYTGLYHSNQQAVEYQWRLLGFQDEWSPPIKERQAVFSNLPPGGYTFEVMARNELNQWGQPAAYEFLINPPWWQLIWVRALAIAALFLGVWAVFQVRLQQIRRKNQRVQERLEMEKNILELEQEAARLQMNPHFIFNCLNSIQGLISVGKSEEARSYLARFGKLMRLILENAREEFVPLEKELAMLENYLQLEQMTTSFDFNFTITIDPKIDPSIYEIPPMLIQPFVENAIVHGIKNKAGAGLIEIAFALHGNVMQCSITDNGVGRAKSAEVNKERRPNHKSTAISVTQQRLKQYGIAQQIATGIEFIDLSENGMATGTQVILRMPYQSFADQGSIG